MQVTHGTAFNVYRFSLMIYVTVRCDVHSLLPLATHHDRQFFNLFDRITWFHNYDLKPKERVHYTQKKSRDLNRTVFPLLKYVIVFQRII